MSIPGKEETEVVALESSNYFAGVPIKKRKFPLFRPSSPTSEELPCLSSVELKVSEPSSELSPFNADIGACSLGTSNANKYPVSDNKEESTANTDGTLVGLDSNLLRDISQGSNMAMHSSMLATKEKLFLSAGQNITAVDKLDSVQTKASAEHAGEILPDILPASRDITPDLFGIPKNIELSLGPEEPIFPSLTSDHTSGCSSQIPVKLDASTLRLSLSQNNCVSGYEAGDSVVNNASNAKRLSWDLNTTMDAWEAPPFDCDGPETIDVRGSCEPGRVDNAVPLTMSTAILEFVSDAGEQFHAVTNVITSSTKSLLSPSGKYSCGDSLQLSLSTVAQAVSGEQSNISAIVDSGRVLPNSNAVEEELIFTRNTSSACDTVKSEPFNAEQDVSARINPIELSNLGNKVLEEKPHIEAVNSLDVNHEKLTEVRSIKPEPVQESKGKQIMSETLVEKVVLCQDSVSLSLGMSPHPKKQHPIGLYSCSEFSKSVDVPNWSESLTHVEEAHKEVRKTQEMVDQVAAGMIIPSLGHDNKESNTPDGMICNQRSEDANTDDIERYKSVADGVVPSTSKYSDGYEFDEENTNILADILDDNHESDYGSEGGDDVLMNSEGENDSKEDECEDGKVQAALQHIEANKDGNEEHTTNNDQECEMSGALDIIVDGSNTRDPNINDDDVLMNSEGENDSKEDDCEDGKVQAALQHIEANKDGNEEHTTNNDQECEMSGALDILVDGNNTRDPNINDGKLEDHGETSDDHMEEGADAVLQKATDKTIDRDCSLQESSTVEETTERADEERSIKPTGRSLSYLSGEIDGQKGHDVEELSDGATTGGQDIGTSADPITNVSNGGTDKPTLRKTELYHSDDNAGKDNSSGDADKNSINKVGRSRIINLPRASNVTSPSKPRFISNRPFQSARGKDRHNDFEGGHVPPRRNSSRSEFYADVLQKFDRNRFRDLSFRNSGTKFLRGRGRGFRQHVEWDSEREFDVDMNYSPGNYRFPRYKRASAGGNAVFEGNGYGMDTSRTSGMGRGGRNLIEDLSSSRQPSSRRLSPGIRDGNRTRGTNNLRRFSGNVNSSRSTGEHSSDLLGPRDGAKFIRGLSKDVIEPTFSHPQPMNEGLDGQFVGGRNFSAAQRRGIPRNRSKSPVRSRTRSPGQWSPPRRSSDGFVELQESTHHRSPTIYRDDRIRSPDRSCFTEDTIHRRCGSPSYVAQHPRDLRNVDSVSSNPNRKRPYDRGLPESTRRFDVTDSHERRGGDEFYRGPIRSSRLHDLGSEGMGNERRKFSERRGPVRSFRPSFNSADGENFRFHEDVNRPFCPETDSKHTERGDVREREFDRGVNYKTGFAASRMRNLEDGGNYRHGGQVWHDDGFDDVPRVKRRNF